MIDTTLFARVFGENGRDRTARTYATAVLMRAARRELPEPLGIVAMARRFRRFGRAESGSATVEFVIWAPVLLFIGVAMFVLSYYIATISEVQQVAHSVARSSIALVNGGGLDRDLCEQLGQDVMPQLVSQMAVIDLARFAPLGACPAQPDALDFFTLSVSYDLRGSSLHSLGELFGLDLGVITRTATIQL